MPEYRFCLIVTLRPHSELSVHIRSYSIRMRENADQNNSEYGHFLTLKAPISQNGQTHSNNLSAKLPTNCLSVFDHFVGFTLKGLSSDIFSRKDKSKNYAVLYLAIKETTS